MLLGVVGFRKRDAATSIAYSQGKMGSDRNPVTRFVHSVTALAPSLSHRGAEITIGCEELAIEEPLYRSEGAPWAQVMIGGYDEEAARRRVCTVGLCSF